MRGSETWRRRRRFHGFLIEHDLGPRRGLRGGCGWGNGGLGGRLRLRFGFEVLHVHLGDIVHASFRLVLLCIRLGAV
jgi:hypothetical protein